MPSDPAALLELAKKKNGLRNVGSAPWHLKASYEVLDDTAGIEETGSFEEFWVSEKKNEYHLRQPQLQSDAVFD